MLEVFRVTQMINDKVVNDHSKQTKSKYVLAPQLKPLNMNQISLEMNALGKAQILWAQGKQNETLKLMNDLSKNS